MVSTQSTLERRIASDETKRPPWRFSTAVVIATTALNVALWAVGQATGVEFVVPGPNGVDDTSVTHVPVVVVTVVSLAVGTAAAVIAAGRSQRWFRAVRVAGVAAATVSLAVPLSLDTDLPTRLLLASMHIVVGIAFVASVSGLTIGRPTGGNR